MTIIDVFTTITERPCFAVGQIEGEHLVLGTDDPLDYVRQDPERTHYMDVHHDSSPFGFLSQDEIHPTGEDVSNEDSDFDTKQFNVSKSQVTFEEDDYYAELAALIMSQQKDVESARRICSGKRKPIIRKRKGVEESTFRDKT